MAAIAAARSQAKVKLDADDESSPDDLDGLPLIKRRRLLTSSSPPPSPSSSAAHAKPPVDIAVKRVSLGALQWPGLPRGVKFIPSDEDLVWHLLSKVGKGSDPHPFIDQFITSLDEVEGFGYIDPQKLPGVKNDGSMSYFFHRTIMTYNIQNNNHRHIQNDDCEDAHWCCTGKIKQVVVDGIYHGFKKTLVLFKCMKNSKNPEQTNWVMHQYHIGKSEEDEGEFAVSKIFYQLRSGQVGTNAQEVASQMVAPINRKVETKVATKSLECKIHGESHEIDLNTRNASVQDTFCDSKNSESSKVCPDVYGDKISQVLLCTSKLNSYPRKSNLANARTCEYNYTYDNSMEGNARLHNGNSCVVPSCNMESQASGQGRKIQLQSSNLPNHVSNIKVEKSDYGVHSCNEGLNVEYPANSGGCMSEFQSQLDHIPLQDHCNVLLSGIHSCPSHSRCFHDCRICALKPNLFDALDAYDGGLLPQCKSTNNLESVHGKENFGFLQGISSGSYLVNNINESDTRNVQDDIHLPQIEDSSRGCYPDSASQNSAANVVNNSVVESSHVMIAGREIKDNICLNNSLNCQTNFSRDSSFAEAFHGSGCISSNEISGSEGQLSLLGKKTLNTGYGHPSSGLSAQLVQVKVESLEEGYINKLSDTNAAVDFDANDSNPLDNCIINHSPTHDPCFLSNNCYLGYSLIGFEESQKNQLNHKCLTEASVSDAMELRHKLAEKNECKKVQGSSLSCEIEVKPEPFKQSDTDGLSDVDPGKAMGSALNVLSTDTFPEVHQFLMKGNGNSILFSEVSSQRNILTESLCSSQISHSKDDSQNPNPTEFLNSTLSVSLETSGKNPLYSSKAGVYQDKALFHDDSSLEETDKEFPNHAASSEKVQFASNCMLSGSVLSRVPVKLKSETLVGGFNGPPRNLPSTFPEPDVSKVTVNMEALDEFLKDIPFNKQLIEQTETLVSGDVSNANCKEETSCSKQIGPNDQTHGPVNSVADQGNQFSVRKKRKKTATNSVETALEEDAPGLLQVLLDKGITLDEIKLYGATEDDEILEISSKDESFEELESVITKLFSEKASLFKLSVARHMKGSKAVYCLACLISLIEQTRYLQFRNSPVEWGWCRDLQSFIFVFERHNRIVLERPEYGYATYFFELVDCLPIDWQIKRLVIAMKLTSCNRTTLMENKHLLVGEDITEHEGRILEEYGWTPNCGLGTMLNYCDRVIHDKKNEKYCSEWRSKIGKLLMAGHDGGRTILINPPKAAARFTANQTPQIKWENLG